MANAVFFSNTAQQTTLSGSISAGATTITVGATTGFPASFPYVLALDYGAATEELVSVTAAAGTNLTVTRAYGGTSAQSHSLGAVVRHVYDATEATAYRTHEAATAAVHGVTGTLVGTSDTQTLANKTLTSPTINGGALSGTFTGTPTLSGALTFTGGPTFSTASPLFVRTNATDVALRATVGGDANNRLAVQADGKLLWSSGAGAADTVLFRETSNTLATADSFLRIYRGAAGNNALAVRVTGDANSRWFINADGNQSWGPGGGSATDTNLYRQAADTLRTDDSFEVGGNLTVTGNITASGVGERLFARKTADTVRTSATLTDDPHLTVTVDASATYDVEAVIIVDTSDATNADLNLDWTVPAGATGRWTGIGQPVGATGTDGDVRTVSTTIDAARTYGATTDSANQLSILVKGLLVTSSSGTYAVSWARTGGSGSLTMVTNSFLKLTRVA